MILKAEKLSKEFIRESRGTNRFPAVKETDMAISSGELIVIMGRSGSGKTTLLNMLAGLLTPTSGRVLLDGTDIYTLGDRELSKLRNRNIGYIPQGQTAIHSLNVLENVLLPYTLYKESGCEQYAQELLTELDIIGLKSAMPSELSGGELRRMSIARALARRPEIVLADEPTGDLDDENTAIVFGFLKKIAADGAAVIVVTHENEAEKYAGRVFRMDGGVLSETSGTDT